MSRVNISDRTQGVFRVEVVFTHEECDRLPFNALRSVRAVIEPVEPDGLRATADFNLRIPVEAEAFLAWLLRFGAGAGLAASPPPPPMSQPATPPPVPSPAYGYGPPAAAPDDDLLPETPPVYRADRRYTQRL